MNNDDNRLTGLWVAVAVLLSLFLGTAAGVIAWSGSHHDADTGMLTGGGAFLLIFTAFLTAISTMRNRS